MPALTELFYLATDNTYTWMRVPRPRALRVIEADLRGETLDVTWVAELDGRTAGAMVAYPYREDPRRERAWLRRMLLRVPPWRWPSILRIQWLGHSAGPNHPDDALYIGVLSTAPDARRRGAATALLRRAERVAVDSGLRGLAVQTGPTNDPALALYRGFGFRVMSGGEKATKDGSIPPPVCLLKEVA